MSIRPFFFGRRDEAFDPFSVDAWEPIESFLFPSASSPAARMSAERRLPFPSPAAGRGLPSFALAAHVDWKETPAAHVFKADLPGVRKDEVKVEVEDGRVLQISGERTREQEDKTDTWHRAERSSGRFLRRFRLPEDAKVDQVRAAMENGVLTVTVPKAAEARKPNVRSVEISG